MAGKRNHPMVGFGCGPVVRKNLEVERERIRPALCEDGEWQSSPHKNGGRLVEIRHAEFADYTSKQVGGGHPHMHWRDH